MRLLVFGAALAFAPAGVAWAETGTCEQGMDLVYQALDADEKFDDANLDAAMTDPLLPSHVQRSYVFATMAFRDVSTASETTPDHMAHALYILSADILLPCWVEDGTATQSDFKIYYGASPERRARLSDLASAIVETHQGSMSSQ